MSKLCDEKKLVSRCFSLPNWANQTDLDWMCGRILVGNRRRETQQQRLFGVCVDNGKYRFMNWNRNLNVPNAIDLFFKPLYCYGAMLQTSDAHR